MAYAERTFSCSGCGKLITRRAPASACPLCVECGIAKSAEVMVQMHRRDGAAYESWLLASIEALTRRLIAYRTRQSFEDIGKTR